MDRIVLPAELAALDKANAFIEKRLGERTEESIRYAVLLAVEEIFVNICSYAYPDEAGEVEMLCEMSGGLLVLTFIDGGVPFDPTGSPRPDIEAPAEERKPGGLGIYLVRELMDEVSYQREGKKNILTLKKSLRRESDEDN